MWSCGVSRKRRDLGQIGNQLIIQTICSEGEEKNKNSAVFRFVVDKMLSWEIHSPGSMVEV